VRIADQWEHIKYLTPEPNFGFWDLEDNGGNLLLIHNKTIEKSNHPAKLMKYSLIKQQINNGF